MDTLNKSFYGHFMTTLLVLTCGLSLSVAQAQTDPAAAQRNIEQLGQQLRERIQAKPLVQVDTLGLQAHTAIDHLVSITVQSGVLPDDIERYWKSRIGQAVSIEQIQDFHAWFYDKATSEGFMAYAKTDVVAVTGGEQLQIQVIQPRINAMRVLGLAGQLETDHLQRVRSRFAEQFKTGMPLDTLALDQALDSASYDLPVELEATLRAVGPELLDLLITVAPALPQSGRPTAGMVQLNNHGLKQYGRAQMAGVVTVGMPPLKSQLSLVAQASEGIAYARADYEALLPMAGARWQLFGSHLHSRSVLGGSASTQGQSSEIGAGLTRILMGERDVVLTGKVELATRQSDSHLQTTGALLSNITDHQTRWRLMAENDRLAKFPMRIELGLTLGKYPEPVSVVVPAGSYAKLDFVLKGQTPLNTDGSLRLGGRLRGQWADRNLDGYNQITLGGINGVRAYTSADGTGDRGVLGSLELTQTLPWNSSLSLFYDLGQVGVQVNPSATSTLKRYSLQGSGVQWQGRYAKFQYALTWAKGHQGYKGWLPSNIESEPNNQRVNLLVSYIY